MNSFPKEDAYLVGPDGKKVGPFKATFGADAVVIWDKSPHIVEGWVVLRSLEDGRVEKHAVMAASFFAGTEKKEPHFQLRVQPL
jgi:hypothetical protein